MKILITGGSRGIGLAIAEELLSFGHSVLITAKNQKKLNAVGKKLTESNAEKILFKSCDLGKASNIKNLSDFCMKENFFPDVIVLNAGIFIEGDLSKSKSRDYLETMHINMNANFELVQNFLPFLKKSKAGKIIIIGSTASYEPYPVGALYGVAKWALRGYAINLRKELMNDGIGVTFLAPGGTLTDLWAGEELPPNRLLEPRDIGKIVATILTLSDQAVVEEIIIRPMLGDFHE
jgi:short-subunit dehydrogenase